LICQFIQESVKADVMPTAPALFEFSNANASCFIKNANQLILSPPGGRGKSKNEERPGIFFRVTEW
jgi:hypothetical protein